MCTKFTTTCQMLCKQLARQTFGQSSLHHLYLFYIHGNTDYDKLSNNLPPWHFCGYTIERNWSTHWKPACLTRWPHTISRVDVGDRTHVAVVRVESDNPWASRTASPPWYSDSYTHLQTFSGGEEGIVGEKLLNLTEQSWFNKTQYDAKYHIMSNLILKLLIKRVV